MQIKELKKLITTRLEKISTEADAESELILNKLFNISKLDILLNKEVENDKLDDLEEVLAHREKRMPLQYIFKEQVFRSYNFYVDSRVLIPRPETEILVDKVIELAKNIDTPYINIVDIGTGSGAIAICLALEIKNAIVFSVDISEDALTVAEINKKKYNIPDKKLSLIKGDKLEVFRDKNIKFDILVSNPPYIPSEQYFQLEKEVLFHEPKLALLGPDDDGLGFYRYFAKEANKYLKSGGFICFEIGYGQANTITDILKRERIFNEIEIIKDYNNVERIVVAGFKNENNTG